MSTPRCLFLQLCTLFCAHALTDDYFHLTVIREEESSTRHRDIHPTQTQLKFSTPVRNVTLDLKRNHRINTDAPVFVDEGGAIRRFLLPKLNTALYTDTESGAAISVLYDPNTRQKTYTGSFHLNGDEYLIEPATRDHIRKKRSTVRLNGVHAVKKRAASAQEARGDAIDPPDNSHPIGAQTAEVSAQQTGKRTYGVELLMVIDYSLYNSWYKQSKETTAEKKNTDAISKIKYYFTHVANGMDLRYMNIEESDFAFYIRLAGFFISTSSQTSPFTENSQLKTMATPRPFADAEKVLDKFQEWTAEKVSSLPTFDHAMLFTRYDLWRGYKSGQRDKGVAGLATIRGICTPNKVSIVEDVGGFRSVATAAHELGHSLGAKHDGNGNPCKTNDQYIMAAITGLATDKNHLNAFKFSTCTISAFRSHLVTLNRDGNCLNNLAQHGDKTAFDAHIRQLPGQLYPPHEQCRQIYGPNSYYCGGPTQDKKICQELYCYDSTRTGCYKENDMRAARGTTCGNKKWCIQGVCTYDIQATTASDTCFHGDYLGTFSDGKTCKSIGESYQHYCYTEFYKQRCCATCGKLYNGNNKGCEYGDKQEWCKTLSTRNCYYNLEQCCSSCPRKSTGIKGCEYGDKADWCSTLKAEDCYANNKTCCQYCKKFETNQPGCEYGDRANWCATLKANECYNNNKTCCQRCTKFRTNVPGCEYGNQYTNCEKHHCAFSNNHQGCCKTCATEGGFTTPKATTTTTTTTTTTGARKTTTTRTSTTTKGTTTITTTRPTTTKATTTTSKSTTTTRPTTTKTTTTMITTTTTRPTTTKTTTTTKASTTTHPTTSKTITPTITTTTTRPTTTKTTTTTKATTTTRPTTSKTTSTARAKTTTHPTIIESRKSTMPVKTITTTRNIHSSTRISTVGSSSAGITGKPTEPTARKASPTARPSASTTTRLAISAAKSPYISPATLVVLIISVILERL